MALKDITDPQAVVHALDEYDELTESVFLKKYGFGKARTVFIERKGNLYDAKAVLGAAHLIQLGEPLGSKDFHSGSRVEKKLDDLGFNPVRVQPDLPVQTIDELEVGTELNNDQLAYLFSVGNMGGMRYSKKRNHLVLICDHTKSLYDDSWEGDVLHYSGTGASGDQALQNQNLQLAESGTSELQVYLFEVFKKNIYKYLGPVSLAGDPYRAQQPGKDGKMRAVWRFPLRLLTDEGRPISQEDIWELEKARERILRGLSLGELKERAGSAPPKPKKKRGTSSKITVRNPDIAAYVKKAAEEVFEGKCALCAEDAPFRDGDNCPFLESHHVHHLADNGPDTIENTVALCPNCHRKMHILDKDRDKKKLREHIEWRDAEVERRLSEYTKSG